MFNRYCLKALLLAGLLLPLASCGGNGLSSIQLAPASVALTVGQSVQFTAWGYYGNGSKPQFHQDITSQVTWGWATTALVPCNGATVATGCFTAVSAGVTEVGATAPGFNGTVGASAQVTITACTTNCGGGGGSTEPVVSLSITPSTDSLALAGQTAQFIALGTTGTGLQENLTTQVAWSSTNSDVATIGAATGFATAKGQGTTQITAIWTNPDKSVVTSNATLAVTGVASEPLLSMTIMPNSQSNAAGQPTQFLAIGNFSAFATTPGTQNMPVTGYTVAWYSSNPAVATVCTTAAANTAALCPTTPGLVTGVGVGTTAITAIASGNPDHSVVTATATFTVTGPAPSSIAGLSIYPGSQSITMPEIDQPNPTVNLVVIGANGTGLLSNLTSQVIWTSSNPQVLPTANIVSGANAAVATAVGTGTTTITASYTNLVTASNPVSSTVTTTASLTVTGPAQEPLLSLVINPDAPSVPFPTQTTQLAAIGTAPQAPITQNLTNSVTWTSSNPLVATVCNATATATVPILCATTPGLVTAVGQGTTAITASIENPDHTLVYATVPFSVNGGSAQQMTALTIIPNALSLSATGQAGSLIALGTSGSTGLQADVTGSPQITWTSSNPAIATVSTASALTQTCALNNATPPVSVCTNDAPGLVKGVSAGSSTITADFKNPASGSTPASDVTATASVGVTATPAAEPLLSITILPATITTGNLLGTGQFLAFGAFSTAPTLLDITNGFYHSGFSSTGYPSASCTAAYAAADWAALVMTNSPTNPPDPQCAYSLVTWISDAPFIFPINSTGAAGANAGLVTANGSGIGDIYAVATNPDGTLVYSTASATFNCPYVAPTYGTTTVTNANGSVVTVPDYSVILNVGSCNDLTIAPQLVSTLTVYGTGLNMGNLPAGWLITAPSATGTPNVIHCGGSAEQALPAGSVCVAAYPNGTQITLTAPAVPGVNFGGWSENCNSITPNPSSAAGPNSCTVSLGTGSSSNVSVVGIFN